MTSKQSIAHDGAAHDGDSCIHCARGWTYHEDEDGEEAAIPCWMCDTIDANYAGLERMGR